VLGTQETFCIVIAGLLERDSFDLFLPEFDKPWVIHLRETCCCPTNLCTWRPNTVYKNRRVRRHHEADALEQGCWSRGGESIIFTQLFWRDAMDLGPRQHGDVLRLTCHSNMCLTACSGSVHHKALLAMVLL
jgi:hypothetical protein